MDRASGSARDKRGAEGPRTCRAESLALAPRWREEVRTYISSIFTAAQEGGRARGSISVCWSIEAGRR